MSLLYLECLFFFSASNTAASGTWGSPCTNDSNESVSWGTDTVFSIVRGRLITITLGKAAFFGDGMFFGGDNAVAAAEAAAAATPELVVA